MLVACVRNPDECNQHCDINLRNARETSCPTDGLTSKKCKFFYAPIYSPNMQFTPLARDGKLCDAHTSGRFYRVLPDETGDFGPCSLAVLFTKLFAFILPRRTRRVTRKLCPYGNFFQTQIAFAQTPCPTTFMNDV